MSIEGKGPRHNISDTKNPNLSSDETKNRLMKELLSPEIIQYIKNLIYKFSPKTQKSDEDDIIQETMLAMNRNIQNGNFDENKSKLRTYIFSVVHNKVKDLYKNKQKEPAFGLDGGEVADSKTPIEDWIKTAHIAGLISQLPTKKKQVMELMLRGYDHAAIAEELKLTRTRVTRIFFDAKEDLKKIIAADEEKNNL